MSVYLRRGRERMDYTGEALSWRHSGAVLEVELHRAPLNEIGTTTLAELERLARHVSDGAGGARALVWHSTRPGFCAGADLRELYRGITERRDRWGAPSAALGSVGRRVVARVGRRVVRHQIRGFVDRIHAAFDTFDQAPLITVAAVHGVVFGGGFELALTADLIVADRTARFCFPELRLGIVPGFGGIPRLMRECGNAVVRDLLLTGRSLNAARAHQLGLVSQLVNKGEALATARRAAEQAAKFDAGAIAAGKALSKPHPADALAREKDLFCALVTRPVVVEALDRFVNDSGVRPYLPASGGTDG